MIFVHANSAGRSVEQVYRCEIGSSAGSPARSSLGLDVALLDVAVVYRFRFFRREGSRLTFTLLLYRPARARTRASRSSSRPPLPRRLRFSTISTAACFIHGAAGLVSAEHPTSEFVTRDQQRWTTSFTRASSDRTPPSSGIDQTISPYRNFTPPLQAPPSPPSPLVPYART